MEFNQAYQCSNNKKGTLQSRVFAFGNNSGAGPAHPSMHQQTTKLEGVYIRTSVGAYQDYIPKDPTAPVTNGIRILADLQAVAERPTVGTMVYMFFPQENG